MHATIDPTRAAHARTIFAAALSKPADKVTYVSGEEFEAACTTAAAKCKPATGVFPNAFEDTGAKYNGLSRRTTFADDFIEGVEEIEPAPFDATDERWGKSYKAPKVSFAHLPIGGFTNGQIHKLSPDEKKCLRNRPIVLDQSRTLSAPTLPDSFHALPEERRTPSRARNTLSEEWLSMQQTAGASQRSQHYRTLTDAQITDFNFTLR